MIIRKGFVLEFITRFETFESWRRKVNSNIDTMSEVDYSDIGLIDALTTSSKSSVVAAVNEINQLMMTLSSGDLIMDGGNADDPNNPVADPSINNPFNMGNSVTTGSGLFDMGSATDTGDGNIYDFGDAILFN